jgi:DNA primase
LLVTTSGAADSAAKANWEPLAGRSVTIWPDNDEAGARYADEVAEQLGAIGCAVRRVDVDELGIAHKGDAVDWLAAHASATSTDILALPCVNNEPSASAPTADAPGSDPWPEPLELRF